jgi:hypothetical protein
MKKRSFGLTALIVGAMMIFTLSACGGLLGGDGDDDEGTTIVDSWDNAWPTFTSGWPSDNILSKYGMSGMTLPGGASKPYYNDYGTSMHVYFISSNSIPSVVHNWLTENNWYRFSYSPDSGNGQTQGLYSKGSLAAEYLTDTTSKNQRWDMIKAWQ